MASYFADCKSSSGKSPKDFSKCILIVPSVSVGNVAQLCVDLLIATHRMERIGFLHHPALLPLVGNNAYEHLSDRGEDCLHTSCEVYYHPAPPGSELLGWIVVQIRAPLAQGQTTVFCTDFIHWMEESQFVHHVVLTSVKAEQRLDDQMDGQPFNYLVVNGNSKQCQAMNAKLLDRAVELGWRALKEGEEEGQGQRKEEESSAVVSLRAALPLSGSGFARRLHQKCKAGKVPLWLVAMFCNQGDNTGDAIAFADQFTKWMNPSSPREARVQWVLPKSWELQFGSPTPQELYC